MGLFDGFFGKSKTEKEADKIAVLLKDDKFLEALGTYNHEIGAELDKRAGKAEKNAKDKYHTNDAQRAADKVTKLKKMNEMLGYLRGAQPEDAAKVALEEPDGFRQLTQNNSPASRRATLAAAELALKVVRNKKDDNIKWRAEEFAERATLYYSEDKDLQNTIKAMTIYEAVKGDPRDAVKRLIESQNKKSTYDNSDQAVVLGTAALLTELSPEHSDYTKSSESKFRLFKLFGDDVQSQIIERLAENGKFLDSNTIGMLIEFAQPETLSYNPVTRAKDMSKQRQEALDALLSKDGVDIFGKTETPRALTYEKKDVVTMMYQTALHEIKEGIPTYLSRLMPDMKSTEAFLNGYNAHLSQTGAPRQVVGLDDLVNGSGPGPTRTTTVLLRNIYQERIKDKDVGPTPSKEMEQELRNVGVLVQDILADEQLELHQKKHVISFASEMILLENAHKLPTGERSNTMQLKKALDENAQDILPRADEGIMAGLLAKWHQNDATRAVAEEVQKIVDNGWQVLWHNGGAPKPGTYIDNMKI